MTTYSAGKFLLPMATLLGAWGGFPDPPRSFVWLTKTLPYGKYFFNWLMIFILVFQGGGGKDPKLSFLASGIFFAFVQLIRYIENLIVPEKKTPVPDSDISNAEDVSKQD